MILDKVICSWIWLCRLFVLVIFILVAVVVAKVFVPRFLKTMMKLSAQVSIPGGFWFESLLIMTS
jgi:uncharacterized membrane protein YqhA